VSWKFTAFLHLRDLIYGSNYHARSHVCGIHMPLTCTKSGFYGPAGARHWLKEAYSSQPVQV